MTKPVTMGPVARPTHPSGAHRAVTFTLPPHLAEWQLPPEWRWGAGFLETDFRHYQEVVDALGRSLSLVTVPDPAHYAWLAAEARRLAHCGHPQIPTTYHYWTKSPESRRGPGYLRRWIAGETVDARLARLGTEGIPYVLTVLRAAGSALAYLHDSGIVHGASSGQNFWVTPTGRFWMIGWQWAAPHSEIPAGVRPDVDRSFPAPEWLVDGWRPTPASDQWQLAAMCFLLLTGERPPSADAPPPVRWLHPEVPQGVADALDRALAPNPDERHASIAAMLRAIDRVEARSTILVGDPVENVLAQTEEKRLRWATADDYDVLSPLGSGTFGSVWRVRDLSLGREVALKMLHPDVARQSNVVMRFRREARLAAQLAHPSIVPIYDWDSRGDVHWYTMELAEGGSVAQLVARQGARPLSEVGPQVYAVLEALVAAHAIGVVHRDLKPENVLIDRYWRWRVTDFGIANIAGEEQGTTTGTPAFAAPEQLLGEPQGTSVDLFAMAAIVYFVLTGRPPFGESDGKTILARQLAKRVDTSDLSPSIAAWLERGLGVTADERFPDAATMREAWLDAVERALDEERQAGTFWGWLTRGFRR